jgi:hypothetical protein
MNIALHLPVNKLSFGQVSTVILKTLFEREKAGDKHDIFLFPISQIDLSSQVQNEEFNQWIKSKILRGLEEYDRDIPVFKLWHLNGSLESFGKKQVLLTFHELDEPTKVEKNIARNSTTLFSSQYSCDVFRSAGVNADFLPLAFDAYNFKVVPRKSVFDDRITFNLCGKCEKRKNHEKVLRAWIKKYGNNTRFALNCAVYNPFLNEEQNRQVVFAALAGQAKPFNVNFFPMMNENSIYNEFLNSADVILGMSGGEGFGLPEFQSVALGKHAVLLQAHAYPSWASDDMVTWVKPSGKVEVYDGMFFHKGQPFNQGNIFDFNEDEFIAACETAIAKVASSKVNQAGLTLQTTFTKDRFVDGILEKLK